MTEEKTDNVEQELNTAQEAVKEEQGTEDASIAVQKLLEEQNERYLRLQADFDNFRRRTRQEKEELSTIVTQNMVLQFLPIMDNFERALTGGKSQDADALLSGVEMIYRQFVQVMEKCGLTPIEAVGQLFDPQKHEAVMRVEDSEQPGGTIVEEFQKGYAVGSKVIRPSMVKVVGQ